MPLQLRRPLVFLDLETTGINTKYDRIVEIAAIKCYPDGTQEEFCRRVNPERPIPPEAVAVHGIRDEDVAQAPTFAALARELLRFLVGCDLGGFGVLRFDLPLLTEEFRRVGLEFSTSAVHTVDAQRIYHLREPRTLSAALRFYCADDHVGAHGAKADVLATMRVLEGEMARYPDLPVDVEGLGQYCNPRDAEALDPDGRLKWRGTEVVLAFGQKSGLPLRELVARDATYLRWILNKDFSPEVKAIVRDALDGKFPQRSASVPEVEAS